MGPATGCRASRPCAAWPSRGTPTRWTRWLTEEAHRIGAARAVDGQSLRRSAPGARPVPVLAALIPRTGQGLVETKTNEIPQRQDGLDPFDVAGRVVTGDALPTQTETARDLVADKLAPDVMTVKGNPRTAADAIAARGATESSPSGPVRGPQRRPH